MKKTLIQPDLEQFPNMFHSLFAGANVYDSSCSAQARVFFVDKDNGYFLKAAPKGTLEKEAQLTRFFHQKRLAADVLAYVSDEKDWMLTERVPGEDCTHPMYLENPEQLCDTTAELLRSLHELDGSGCPVSDRTEAYLATAKENYQNGICDLSLFSEQWKFSSPEEAWSVVERSAHLLRKDTLLHGDYCLPNVMLKQWKFSGFVDLDSGGMGDRHVDLFWGIWTLYFNLKTNRYQERFLDAYGRSEVNLDMLRVIAAIEVFG